MVHAFVRVSLALACLAGGAVACGSDDTAGSGPPPFVPGRVYMLQSIDGAPLPYYLYASGGDTTAVLDETFTLFDDGTATRLETRRTVVNGAAATTGSSTTRYTYTIDGTQLVLQVVCPPGALCIVPPTGSVTAAELTLVSPLPTRATAVWRYTRQWPPD